ncbi:TPA: class I SAM-dependent methyltransferase [Candidatus Woesearchaeota archaeon]|nr:Methyltransferase type 11 [archaeon GW2011_AR15]MBS3104307.1 class I SAM-dependent methyltransferase [Candidatus Woesearchaeota archaeon]HIH41873.1 class I SAM-dependent methyltransferase [Candidatus Woesearchaeota archaeon]
MNSIIAANLHYNDYEDWKPSPSRKRFIANYARGESLLEIGCGKYPVSVDAAVPNKVGLDISIYACEETPGGFQRIIHADITKIKREDNIGVYDTVIASEILEHLKHPEEALRTIEFLLKDDGRLLITVPNPRSIAARVDKALHSGNFYDFEEFHKGHVSMHTTKEWKKMFAAAGYQPVAEEYRRAWIVKDINPPFAKKLSRMCPDLFAHQFYFALEKTMQN